MLLLNAVPLISQFFKIEPLLLLKLSLLPSVINVTQIHLLLWGVKNPFSRIDSYDFSFLHNTLPYNLIKEKFSYLINWPLKKSGFLTYAAINIIPF